MYFSTKMEKWLVHIFQNQLPWKFSKCKKSQKGRIKLLSLKNATIVKSPWQQVFLIVGLTLILSACTKTISILEKAEHLENAMDYAGAYEVYSEGLKTNPDNQIYLWKRAIVSLQISKVDEALAYCEKQLKKYPQDSRALLLKARCYDYLGFQNLPKSIYKNALSNSRDTKSPEEKLLLASAYRLLKKEKDREKILRGILRKFNSPKNPKEFVIKGTVLRHLDRFEEARQTYETGLKRFPKAAYLHLYLGALYGFQGDSKRSREEAKYAIKLGCDPLWSTAMKGAALYDEGKYEEALKYLHESIKLQPDYLTARYLRLKSYAYLKELDKSKEEMKTILSFEPGNTWATTNMSTAYDIAGDKKEAIAILKRRLKSIPGNETLTVALADAYIKKENYDETWKLLEEFLKDHKKCADAYYYRATIYKNNKHYEKAIEDIETAIALDKHIGNYYLLKTETLRSLGKTKESLSSAQKYASFYPGDKYAKRLLAEGYIFNNQFHKALQITNQAIKEYPDYHWLFFSRSLAYGMLGENEKEEADFKIALSCDGQDKATWHYCRGIVYRHLEKFKKAIKALTKSIELKPQNEFSWCARGCLNYKIGEYRKSISDCDKSLSINPKRVHPLISRGSSYRELGELDKSLEDLNKAAYEAPKWGEIFYERSLLYTKLNEQDKAKDDMDKSIALGYRPEKNIN